MNTNEEDYREMGIVLLRCALGIMWIAHALLKWNVFTIVGFGGWLETQGLPSIMAWPVFLLELIGGLAIIAGIYGRYVSAVLLPILFVVIWTHISNGWSHTSTGGGWEYPVFLVAVSIAHILLGDGKFALNERIQRFSF